MEIAGYHGVKVPLTHYPDKHRYIYLKRHESKKNKGEEKTELFGINVPLLSSALSIEKLFEEECGKLESVTFGSARPAHTDKLKLPKQTDTGKRSQDFNFNRILGHSVPSTQAAKQTPIATKKPKKYDPEKRQLSNVFMQIKFLSEKGAKKALKIDRAGPAVLTNSVGLARYRELYASKLRDREELEKEVDAFMIDFEEKKNELEMESEAKNNVMDEDGFVVVSHKRKGNKKHSGDGRAHAQSARIRESDSKKKRDKVLEDFYKFQRVEQKQASVEELRKKFQADKERIAKMRGERKFRPY